MKKYLILPFFILIFVLGGFFVTLKKVSAYGSFSAEDIVDICGEDIFCMDFLDSITGGSGSGSYIAPPAPPNFTPNWQVGSGKISTDIQYSDYHPLYDAGVAKASWDSWMKNQYNPNGFLSAQAQNTTGQTFEAGPIIQNEIWWRYNEVDQAGNEKWNPADLNYINIDPDNWNSHFFPSVSVKTITWGPRALTNSEATLLSQGWTIQSNNLYIRGTDGLAGDIFPGWMKIDQSSAIKTTTLYLFPGNYQWGAGFTFINGVGTTSEKYPTSSNINGLSVAQQSPNPLPTQIVWPSSLANHYTVYLAQGKQKRAGSTFAYKPHSARLDGEVQPLRLIQREITGNSFNLPDNLLSWGKDYSARVEGFNAKGTMVVAWECSLTTLPKVSPPASGPLTISDNEGIFNCITPTQVTNPGILGALTNFVRSVVERFKAAPTTTPFVTTREKTMPVTTPVQQAPARQIMAEDVKLSWIAAEGAQYHYVTVFDSNGNIVIPEQKITGLTQFTVPAESLVPGQIYYYEVVGAKQSVVTPGKELRGSAFRQSFTAVQRTRTDQVKGIEPSSFLPAPVDLKSFQNLYEFEVETQTQADF